MSKFGVSLFLSCFYINFVFGDMECKDGRSNKNCLLESGRVARQNIQQKNLNGTKLEVCSLDPITGFTRTGYCVYEKSDRGSHLVCGVVNKEFLEYTKSKGNDLSTANPRYNFKGLVPGDRWCLCSARVVEANRNGLNLKIIKEATHEKAWD